MKLILPLLAEFYDYTGASQRLNRLARRGWKLTGVGTWFWTFEKTEPQQLHYSVVYFPDVHDLDPNPKIELLDYIAMCEAAGWKLVAQQNQRLIFCSEESDPVPIDTDPTIQVETIHKVMKKTHVRGYLIAIALAVFYLLRDLGELRDYGCYFLADSFDIMFLCLETVILLLAVLEIVTYFLWLRKARIAAERGEFVSSKKTALMSILELAAFPLGLLILAVTVDDSAAVLPIAGLFVIILVIQAAVSWFGKFLKGQGYDVGSNQIMQVGVMTLVLFAVLMLWAMKTSEYVNEKRHEASAGSVELSGNLHYYNDHDLPLSLESLGIPQGDAVYDRTLEETASPLMSIVSGIDRPVLWWLEEMEELPALDYTLTVAKVPWLREYMKDRKLQQYEELFAGANRRAWQAERVLKHNRIGFENYVVFWEDRVLEISFPKEPTVEQIELVTDCMKGGIFG